VGGSTLSRIRLFGGFVEWTKSDLYRFHLRIGSFAIYKETEKLYAVVKEARTRDQVKK
jgi:hypothetical protein